MNNLYFKLELFNYSGNKYIERVFLKIIMQKVIFG